MKLSNLLPLAVATLLIGCATPPADKDQSLNDTLPKLTLQDVLPAPVANEYCNATMDSDILYGIGSRLFNNDELQEAKSCFIMAAPKHDRAFCFLATITEQDKSKTEAQRNTEAFNYIAYSAAKNDWCAAFGMYQSYSYPSRGAQQDKALALRWLERSARHGSPDSQHMLMSLYENEGKLVDSYAWSKIKSTEDDTSDTDDLKKEMTPEQIAQGEALYAELRKTVTTQKAMYDEAREEDIGLYSAHIHLDFPDTFKGMPSAERYNFVKQSIATVLAYPGMETRGQVLSYIIIARQAQLKNPTIDILQNAQIVAILKDDNLTMGQTIDQATSILNTAYK